MVQQQRQEIASQTCIPNEVFPYLKQIKFSKYVHRIALKYLSLFILIHQNAQTEASPGKPSQQKTIEEKKVRIELHKKKKTDNYLQKLFKSLFKETKDSIKTNKELCHQKEAASCLRHAKSLHQEKNSPEALVYFELGCIYRSKDSCKEFEKVKTQIQDRKRHLQYQFKLEKRLCSKNKHAHCRKLANIQIELGKENAAQESFKRACYLGNSASCMYLHLKYQEKNKVKLADEYYKLYKKQFAQEKERSK